MLPKSSYKIKIIHCHTPHLIWVERGSTFEQIGIFGIVPHSKTLVLNQNGTGYSFVEAAVCDWLPAALNLMREFLVSNEIWFSPEHFDDGAMFREGQHRYGDLYKLADGVIVKLSEHLVKSRFAIKNTKIFYKLLEERLPTKLKYTDLYEILKKLMMHYENCDLVRDLETIAKRFMLCYKNSDVSDLICVKYSDFKSAEPTPNYNQSGVNVTEERRTVRNVTMLKKLENFKILMGNIASESLLTTKEEQKDLREKNINSNKQGNLNSMQIKLNRLKEATAKQQNRDKIDEIVALKIQNQANKDDADVKMQNRAKIDEVVALKIQNQAKKDNAGVKIQNRAKIDEVLADKAQNHANKDDAGVNTQNRAKIDEILADKAQNHANKDDAGVKTQNRAKNNVATTQNTPSNENMDDIMDYINKKYPKSDKVKIKKDKDTLDITDVSRPMCRFVDKMITPVVMVHSKCGKMIRANLNIRNIYFNNHIRIALKSMSVHQPMALQGVTWSTILRGHSVFMIGPKSSGKTMGYLPSVCRLVSDGSDVESVGPIAIIVCATSESVAQVEKYASMLLGVKDRVVACYPGIKDISITTSLLNGCEILISTPNFLVRLLNDDNFGIDLRRLKLFVLDDCERLNSVFQNEIKFFHHKIRSVEKSRLYKVQYVVASRIWCEFMVPLARRVPDTVVCISAFTECLLYSKAKMTVSFGKRDEKVKTLVEFLDQNDDDKKTVIVCRSDDDVKYLSDELKRRKECVFVCHNEMSLSDLHRLNTAWIDYDAPLIGAILICTDDNLAHLNVTDGNYLVHFSLPKSYSFFRKRFFVLNDKYSSIFHPNKDDIKVKIILDENDTEKLPKILNFIKRCTDVPKELEDLSKRVVAAKDAAKADALVPICGSLLTLGYCPEFYECLNRHAVLKHDEPPSWLPRTGIVTFKIVHFHTASNYSAHLLSHFDGKVMKFPQMYAVYIKLGMYYGSTANRRLHGVPKVGDLCAFSVKQHSFARCQVVKIFEKKQKEYRVLVKLIDEERYEETKDIYLYHLPDDMAAIETYTVQIRLANVQPKDNDVTFSALAMKHLKRLVDDENCHMRARIVGAIGNCLFVDTLEVCEDLSTLDRIVVKHDLKEELLSKHADVYPDHLDKIKALCDEIDFYPVKIVKELTKEPKKIARWAHLNMNELEGVYVMNVLSPDKFIVRIGKFESCMQTLLKDIRKFIDSTEPEPPTDVNKGDILLAKYPDDEIYERAKVEDINGDMIKCFFVDQGDSAHIQRKDLMPISDTLIGQLPFQSIECRLIGVKPPGSVWSDFSINWLSDYVDEGTKHFFARAFIKESSEITDGYKYAIVLIDTDSNQDVIINQRIIELNFALVSDDESHHLNAAIPKNVDGIQVCDDENHHLDDVIPKDEGTPQDWEKIELPDRNQGVIPYRKNNSQLIRSVPLVGSDCESNGSDPWEIYNISEFTSRMVKSKANDDSTLTKNDETKMIDDAEIKAIKQLNKSSDSLLSDVSLLNSQEDLDYNDTVTKAEIGDARKPKLLWRQTKTNVNIKIQLIVEEYDLKIGERKISFSAFSNNSRYAFDFELYGVVDKLQSNHSNKGQYIMVKMKKLMMKKWSTLTKEPVIKRWIAYDNEHLDISSEEELIDDSILDIVKTIHARGNGIDSDDDDDAVMDDFSYRYE